MTGSSLAATVSGSFHRHMAAISEAVQDLRAHGVRVLSPADPRVVDADGEFLYVASDRARSIKLVQDRHLACIQSASFLWLVAPEGYVGSSAAMELGFAAAASVPIFCTFKPSDLTLQRYVRVVPNIMEALRAVPATRRASSENLLIDPVAALEQAHRKLDELRSQYNLLVSGRAPVVNFYRLSEELAETFRLAPPVLDD